MRIGHYMNGIWQAGGKASYILRTAGAQAEAGHHVVLLDTDPVPPGQAPPAGVDHSTVGSFDDLCRQARERRLDVVNAHTALPHVPAGAVPFVRTVHIHNPYCPSGTRYLSRWQTPCDRAYSLTGCLWGHVVDRCGSVRPRKMQKRFRRIGEQRAIHRHVPVLAVSRFVKEQMVRSGYDEEQIAVLHSPAPQTDAAHVPPPEDGPPRFLFMGRIVAQKGVAWLLRAFAQVKTPAYLDIAGEGGQQADMEELARTLGVADRVTFHGWVPAEHVDALIQAARAVVFPSVWHEPAGLVTLEAAALGRPVIASRTGGIPEYVDAAYAFLVPPNDTGALAARIQELAQDRARAEAMGRRGRELVRRRFSMDRFLHELEGHYAAAIEARAAAPPAS